MKKKNANVLYVVKTPQFSAEDMKKAVLTLI